MKIQQALIAVCVDFLDGVSAFKVIIGQITKFAHISDHSSIYKKYLNQRKEDMNSQLWMSLRIETHLKPDELLGELGLCEVLYSQDRRGRPIQILLLAYESETVMTPKLTLPYPKLHDEYHLLVTTSEIWRDYRHPVLGVTLNELASHCKQRTMVEFLEQGKSLLDFSQ